MKVTALYEHLLGLKMPWSVKSADHSLTNLRVAVEVALKPSQVLVDPRTVPSELTRLAWNTVNGIMVSAVERGMLRRREDELPHLGLGKKSSERGHIYVSILIDIDRSRVLDLVPERKLAAAKSLLGTLSPTQRASVKALAMDMWPAFMSAVQTCIPQADIIHDRFHVSKHLGEVVDTERKQERRSLSLAGTSPLAGSKWVWLMSYADGHSSEAVSFRTLNQLNLKTSRAWRIKGTFTKFWCYHYAGAAQRFFAACSNNAMRSRLKPIKEVVKILRRHLTGLLILSEYSINNACTEGFNNAIQLIKANAKGFRNFTNYRARILFHCGKLDMS